MPLAIPTSHHLEYRVFARPYPATRRTPCHWTGRAPRHHSVAWKPLHGSVLRHDLMHRSTLFIYHKLVTSPGKQQFWSDQYVSLVEFVYVLDRDKLPPTRQNTHKQHARQGRRWRRLRQMMTVIKLMISFERLSCVPRWQNPTRNCAAGAVTPIRRAGGLVSDSETEDDRANRQFEEVTGALFSNKQIQQRTLTET